MNHKLHNPKSHSPAVYIPCWLIQVSIQLLSNGAKMTYGRLSQWATAQGKAFRSIPCLAQELGCSERSVQEYLRELKAAKLIGIYHLKAGGVNYYEFYDHPWMHKPINEHLIYKDDKPTLPHHSVVPTTPECGTLPHDRVALNNKEIKRNKEIYREPKTNCSQNDLPTQPKEPDPTPPEKPTKKELKPVEYPDTYYSPQEFVQEKTVSDDTFLEFWNLYPVKKALNRAKGAWHSNRCHLKKDEILSKLKEQLANDRQYLTGFAPNPDKYLLEERWKDEIQCAKITEPKGKKRADNQSTDWILKLKDKGY